MHRFNICIFASKLFIMNRLVFFLIYLIVGYQGFSQYNDTMYFKSGHVKSCTIVEYDEKFLKYEYRNHNKKLVSNKISISSLKSFVIYNEFNELIFDSKTGFRKEEE